jgi:hypothetical protein
MPGMGVVVGGLLRGSAESGDRMSRNTETIPDVAIIAVWAFVGILMKIMSDEAIKRMLRPEILARVIDELRADSGEDPK